MTPKMKKLALQFETATASTMLFFAGRQVAKTKHCKNIFVKPTEILFQIPLPVYRDGLEETPFFRIHRKKTWAVFNRLIAEYLEYFA